MKRAANSEISLLPCKWSEGKGLQRFCMKELHLGSVLGARKSKCRRIAEGLLHGLFRWLPVLSRYFWGKINEGSWGVSAGERCFGSSINTPAIKPVGPAGWLSLGADRTA